MTGLPLTMVTVSVSSAMVNPLSPASSKVRSVYSVDVMTSAAAAA